MKTSLPNQLIGCIGKCSSGLTKEELDYVTDNTHKTLTHPQGRRIFREYLKRTQRQDDLACLDFYEKCMGYIVKEQDYHKSMRNPTLEFLTADVIEAMAIAENLDGVVEIDMALLERFNEITTGPASREAMISVLEETKIRLMNHLRNAHGGFRRYALSPCPGTK